MDYNAWLQSIDDPSLAMVVVDPYVYFPDYEVMLNDEDSVLLKVQKPEDAVILTTVSIRKAPAGITTNLLGPLVIGTQSRQALQLVLDGDRYSVKQPLPIKTEQPDEKTLQRSA
jgi:flagellar assembly factor FliW